MGILARRRAAAEAPDGEARYDGLEADRGKWPHLVAFLVDASYSDGSSRDIGGTITVSCDAGGLRVRLCDRDNGEVAFHTADTIAGLLKQLEAWLAGDALEWRVDTFRKKKKK